MNYTVSYLTWYRCCYCYISTATTAHIRYTSKVPSNRWEPYLYAHYVTGLLEFNAEVMTSPSDTLLQRYSGRIQSEVYPRHDKTAASLSVIYLFYGLKNHKWVPGISPGGKGGRCLGLTTLPHSCADCLKIWEPQTPGTLRACPGL
jgi:hypothetical protein